MVLGKAIGGVALVGLISVGGVAIAKPEWIGMSDPMPEKWHSLAEDSDFDTKKGQNGNEGYQGGMGKKYSRYLVGVTNKKDGTSDDNNKYWWEWSFRKLEKDQKSGDSKPGTKFASAKNYGTGNESIDKICEAAYKANHTSEFLTTTTGGTGNENKYKEDDVWKYCSPLGRKPVSVKETKARKETTTSGHIGMDNTEQATLVSTTDPKNDLFWEIRDKEFKAGTSPFNIDSTGTDNEYFKNKKSKGDEHIRNICAEAYTKPATTSSSSTENPKKEEVVKFCAFKEDTQ